jgi:cytochrome d ubiquinol oxidase subunit I
MDPVLLGRLQFATTTIYHFFFVPLTLGLSIIVAIMETFYVRTGKEVYKDMTKFWGKLFVINFAIGVVTGIVQEFQFGMNWAEYSRFVGDIFGVPLALEALLTFFLESVFIGVWVFGWDKLSKGAHAATIWLVALGSNASAFWILVANSFMQQPLGYVIENGRAVMTDFGALVRNPTLWVEFPHTFAAGLTTAAFFVLGISAYHLIRNQNMDAFRKSFQIAAVIGVISATVVGVIGHTQTQHMVRIQPMKMAAAEALWETEEPATFSLISITNLEGTGDVFSIRIPYVLCLLAYNRLSCKIEGVHNLQAAYVKEFGPGNYTPPVAVTYWSFRIMVGAGTLLVLLGIYAIYLIWKKDYEKHKKWLKLFVWGLFLPFIANSFGWIMTEVGRFPWIVYRVMLVEKGVSKVITGGHVLFSLLGFTLIYGVLMVADVYLMLKYARAGILSNDNNADNEVDQAPSLVGAQD